MLYWVQNLGIRTKLWAITLFSIVGITVIVAYSAGTLKHNLLQDRMAKTRDLVESTHSLVVHFYEASQSGKLSETQAKTAATEVVKAIRYGSKGYFWINDFTPRVVMHPHKQDLIGKDMSNVKDGAGKYHWRAFVDVVQRDGGGFVDYTFLHKAKGVVAPKISYVKGFKPWGWIIGTGIYVDDVDDIFYQLLIRQLLLVLASLFVMVLVSIWIGRSIIKPVQRLSNVISHVETEGQLTERTGFQHGDEIGQAGRAFDRMLEQIAGFTSEIQAVSQQLFAKSDQLSDITGKTSAGMQNQQQQTQQASTTMTEMATTANDVAGNAANTSTVTTEVNNKVKQSCVVLQDTIGSMQTMSEHMQNVSNLISHLENETDRIGSVLNVIRGIAEQTNLLALNAAIEAARAGDMGRGFAVVADEVRTLAQRTQASTAEIDEMISNLQTSTSDLVTAKDKGMEATELGLNQAATMDASLTEIVQAIANIDNLNIQIATAAEQQGTVSAEINNNIANINDGAVAIASMTSEMIAISRDTREAAQQMQGVSARFRI